MCNLRGLTHNSVRRELQKEKLDSMVSRDLPVTMTTTNDCDTDAQEGGVVMCM